MSQDIFVVIEHLQGKVLDISYIMLAAARQLSQSTGGGVTAVLLGHNAQGLAGNLAADKVLYMDHPALVEFTSDAYQIALAGLIQEQSPRAVLFGHSSIGMDIACGLSAKLGLPVVSSCRTFSDEGKYTCQICGGKIMVEGLCPDQQSWLPWYPVGTRPSKGRVPRRLQ